MELIPPVRPASLEQLRQHLQDAKVRYDFAKTYAGRPESVEGPVRDSPIVVVSAVRHHKG